MPRRRNNTGLVANEVRILDFLVRSANENSPGHATEATIYGYTVSLELDRQAEVLREQPISNATVYRCLRSLEKFGALTSEWESDADALAGNREGRKRRYYRITALAQPLLDSGKAALDGRPAWLRASQA